MVMELLCEYLAKMGKLANISKVSIYSFTIPLYV